MKFLLVAAMAAIGIALLRLSRRERRDLKLVEHADRAAAPRDGERVAVCGALETDDEPLISPVQQRPAALYHFSVYHIEHKPGGSESSSDVVDFAGYGAVSARVAGIALGGFPILHDFDAKGIDSDDARDRVKEYLRSAKPKPMERGRIEWIHVPDEAMWDGRTRVVRDFQCGEGRPIGQCRFNEAVVSPGEQVCAIGVWSGERNALVAAKGQDLWLYRGTRETVREVLGSSVGCGRFLGILLILGSIAAAAWLAGWF